MSNDKTIVPGMGANAPVSNMPVGGGNNLGFNQPYKGTYVPGMTKSVGQTNKRPIMGFLFSVSRAEEGEYWPLYLGQNSIGKASENDICLAEETISNVHANIVVRPMHNPDGILVFIEDKGSTCGTMVNDSSLGLSPVECHNGDIIKIGAHYDLYLILVDVKSLGLKKCEEFEAAQGAPVSSPFQQPGPQMPFTPKPMGVNQTMPNTQGFNPGVNGGTVVMGPGKKF